MKAKPPLTFCEAEVLARVSLGRDPWGTSRGTQSRTVSQAMVRLKNKGFITYSYHSGGRSESTQEGDEALRETFYQAMRNGQRFGEELR